MDFKIEMEYSTKFLVKTAKSESRTFIICFRIVAFTLVFVSAALVIFYSLNGGALVEEWENLFTSIALVVMIMKYPQIVAALQKIKRKMTGRDGKFELCFHDNSLDLFYLKSGKHLHFSQQEIGTIKKEKYYYRIKIGIIKSIFIERGKFDDESYVMLEKWISKIEETKS